MSEMKQDYDAAQKRGVLTFPNGRTLSIGNVTKDQFSIFCDQHAAEFQKRDCCLQTVDGTFTRDANE
jgi:hypothetical protein